MDSSRSGNERDLAHDDASAQREDVARATTMHGQVRAQRRESRPRLHLVVASGASNGRHGPPVLPDVFDAWRRV